MRFTMKRITAASMLALAGCMASAPAAPTPAPQEVVVHATPERVWSALLLIYTDFNVPVENMDRSSWFMRSAEQKLPDGQESANADCGRYLGSDRAAILDVYVRITTLLRPIGAESTAVRVNAHFRGFDPSAARDPTIFAGNPTAECVSRGAFEKRVLAAITARTT